MTNKHIEAIKKAYTVIQESSFGNGCSLILEVADKNFAVMQDGESLTVYQSYLSGNDWKFLPSNKTSKTKKAIDNFIAARTN
jgi:hypothetical protein